jgi:cytochrome P450
VTILSDPAYAVPPPPPAGPVGTLAWLRATVSRFSAGADHARRRALIVERLSALDPAALRERARELGDPVVPLAEALGARDAAAAASAVAAIAPHYLLGGEADDAVAELLALLPPAEPERAAQDIAILVQAHAATHALIAAGGELDPPPVPATRRIAPDGTLVTVDLSGIPFGEGPRACPGAELALALAGGVLQRR